MGSKGKRREDSRLSQSQHIGGEILSHSSPSCIHCTLSVISPLRTAAPFHPSVVPY